MNDQIIAVFFNLISLISPLIIFIACCYYMSKQSKIDSILLTIGSGVGLLLSCLYSVIIPYLMRIGSLSVSETTKSYTVLGVISFIAGICFAVGLFILIANTVKRNSGNDTNFPTSNY